jgi:hypothetical protein
MISLTMALQSFKIHELVTFCSLTPGAGMAEEASGIGFICLGTHCFVAHEVSYV